MQQNNSSLVQPALLHFVSHETPRAGKSQPKLWPSDLGNCPRKAALRMQGYESTVPFSPDGKLVMHNGVVFEDDTLAALKAEYGYYNVATQLYLGNDLWSGYLDYILWHGTPDAVIIEHKAQGDRWWNYNQTIPSHSHVMQIWLYGQLYKECFGFIPGLRLFYRAWGHYAELVLTDPTPGKVILEGTMDGEAIARILPINLEAARQELEDIITKNVLPPRLQNRDNGCNWQGKPSCSMYWHCWPAEPGHPEC